MHFEFLTDTRIIFGPGTAAQAGILSSGLGRRPLIVTGRTAAHSGPARKSLADRGLEGPLFSVAGEPTVEMVARAVEVARVDACDMIVAIGGGSVIDAAKAAAALVMNPGDILEYLEVIGAGRPLGRPSLPVIALPTTSGTGAEVTQNAVLSAPEQRTKVSLRGPRLLPRVAIIDPELAWTMPPELTAATGLDAVTQLIEPLVSSRANVMADAFSREGLRRAAKSLLRAYVHGDDEDARENMAIASLFGGLALMSAGLGAVHGFAAPVGGLFPAPHGAVCARLLPAVMAVNVQALKERLPGSPALARYEEISRILTGDVRASVRSGIKWVEDLGGTLGIPPLSSYGMTSSDIPVLVERAAAASSMKGNPIQLTPREMREILDRAL